MFDAGKRVTELRESQGLKITALANLSGIAQSSLSYIESGKNNPTIDTVSKICDALGITLVDFFDLKNQDLSHIPPGIYEFVTKKQNHGLLKLIRAMIDDGYSPGVIEEWVTSLSKTLELIRKKYDIRSLEDQVIWADE